ncbi:hypothetical protein ACGVWS_11585 [Enterobacteriaceae bacterium LUAb1]
MKGNGWQPAAFSDSFTHDFAVWHLIEYGQPREHFASLTIQAPYNGSQI